VLNCLKRIQPLILAAAVVMGMANGTIAFATQQESTINEWCPVMTDEKIDPAITIEYRGKTVAFCCDLCLKKFRANPEKYVSRLPQFAEAELAEDSEQQEAAGHVHEVQEPDSEREPLLGRIHPIIIHFPIAGMPIAMLGFLVWVWSGREAFARSDAIPLFVATLASITAVITGNIAHDAMRFSDSLHIIVERHQFVSTAIMVMAICLSIIRLWRWKELKGLWRWVYGGGLAIVCALLGYTGFLGGSLVFGPDHLAW